MFKFLMKKFSKNTEEIEEVEEVKQDNKNEYEDYIDVVCQIMTEDNKLLFVGQIDDFDASTEQLKINPYREEETPKGVSYDTPVKINMKYKGNIIIVHGEIAVQSNENALERKISRKDQPGNSIFQTGPSPAYLSFRRASMIALTLMGSPYRLIKPAESV